MVLHLIASSFFGGPEKQILTHLASAARSGLRVGACAFAGTGMSTELAERALSLGIPSFLIETDNKFDLRSLRRFRDIIRENGVRIVCSHGFKADFYTYLVSKLTPVAKIGFVRGDTSENLKVRFYTMIDKAVIRRYGRVVTLSEAQKRKLVGLGVPEGRISVIFNAIDIDAIRKAASREIGDLPGEKEFVGSRRFIVTVGRLSPEKGHAVLLEAMPDILAAQPDLRLVMVGDGQERSRLEAGIRRLGLRESVLMPGFSRTAAYYMKKAEIVVNPSFSEGMPNVVLEARALKVPVVATDVGGVSEIMPKGQGGVLVPPGDPRSLAAAVARLAGDGDLARRAVEDGYGEFCRRFSVECQTASLLELYRSLERRSA